MTSKIGVRLSAGALRPVWLTACAALLAVLATIPLAGTAAAASGTPCRVSNGACVALGSSGYDATAWMVRNGRVVRGPVSALTGGPGADTPVGTFRVSSKDLHHVSSATRDARGRPSPMPYSVFFGSNGVAFHGTQAGDDSKNRTAGCVRLPNSDASYFFSHLSVGDTVQVVQGDGDYSRDRDRHRSHGGGGGGLLGGL
jgi:lipoprotein-anchoring transpeptidase ErfK/SrfK